jgi:hypothetical protein
MEMTEVCFLNQEAIEEAQDPDFIKDLIQDIIIFPFIREVN